jgi:hypothetical protein
MRILQKRGDTLEILCSPSELNLSIGDYLKISQGNGILLAQVVDVAYADLPGAVEDLLRDLVVEEVDGAKVIDPYNTGSISMLMRETRMLVAKIRCVLKGDKVVHNSSWLPSRYTAVFERATSEYLGRLITWDDAGLSVEVGFIAEEPFTLSLRNLDGCLTIVTGKKESGKSHMAKLLVQGIVSHGGTVLVFDVNGEYLYLDRRVDGKPSSLARAMQRLEPGVNFKTTLQSMGLKTFLDILEHVYATPPTSLRELARLWKKLERKEGTPSLDTLLECVEKEPMNEAVRDALLTRLQSIISSGFIGDDDASDLGSILEARPGGNLVVVNLSKLLPSIRRLVVEYLLSHVASLLSQERIEPLFLLAEEAHLYLRETYWEDIVTRMRHLGLFPIFVTNQPDTIPEVVYRQADNIFLFNLMNDNDLEKIAKVSKVDAETIRLLVKRMPPRHCLVTGRIVNDIPLLIKVRPSELQTMGRTKLFFKNRSHTKIGVAGT